MKTKILGLLALIVLASCTAPKYSYYFDHYNNAAKKQSQPPKKTTLLHTDSQLLTACVDEQPALFSEVAVESAALLKNTYLQMTKKEQRAFRHHLKKEIKTFVKTKKKAGSVESIETSNAMDHDLKLAAIFGAIGLVGLILNSVSVAFGIIGGIALIVGVVFLVMWIIRQ